MAEPGDKAQKTLRDRYRELGPKGFARFILIKRVGKTFFRRLDRWMVNSSEVGNPAVFEDGVFPWTRDLEAAAPKIRAELDELLQYREHLPTLYEIQPDQGKVASGTGWQTYVLWGYGVRSERSCARCPATSAAIESLPGLDGAFFSILAAGTHIPRHSGVTKGVVRCHLGLRVPPQGRCEMRVGHDMVQWHEGRCVVFDDSAKHEVWNDTSEDRVVLIIDVRRPMRWPGRLAAAVQRRVLRASPFFRSALRNQTEWEDRVEGVLPERAGAPPDRSAAPPDRSAAPPDSPAVPPSA